MPSYQYYEGENTNVQARNTAILHPGSRFFSLPKWFSIVRPNTLHRAGNSAPSAAFKGIASGTDALRCQYTRSGGLNEPLASAEIGHDVLVDLSRKQAF